MAGELTGGVTSKEVVDVADEDCCSYDDDDVVAVVPILLLISIVMDGQDDKSAKHSSPHGQWSLLPSGHGCLHLLLASPQLVPQ
jgi:hypothetical protein